jgi:hypothetical protein
MVCGGTGWRLAQGRFGHGRIGRAQTEPLQGTRSTMSAAGADQDEPQDCPDRPAPLALLTIVLTTVGDRVIIQADGALDAAGGDLLLDAVRDVGCGLVTFELDLRGVTAADLAGVRSLHTLRAAVEDFGANFVIRYANSAAFPTDWQTVPASRGFDAQETSDHDVDDGG